MLRISFRSGYILEVDVMFDEFRDRQFNWLLGGGSGLMPIGNRLINLDQIESVIETGFVE